MDAKRFVVLMALAAIALPACADEEGVALTIYNGGYGVVREVRELNVPNSGRVMFTDVAARIDPTTVHFKSITDPEAKLLEQNYQYDLVSADKLLDKYIDRNIRIETQAGGYSGKLLSYDSGQLVLDLDDGGIAMVRRGENVRDIRFGELPEGLLTRPTLVWLVSTDTAGKHLAEVSYQTDGLGWHAEYVFVLDEADTKADLSGWVSVDNKSGKTYRDAKLKFIAGDVHRAPRPPAVPRYDGARTGAMAEAAPMEEKAFFEYHMYMLPRPSTVADNEVKQLEMFPTARDVSVTKRFVYRPLSGFRWNPGRRNTDASAAGGDGKVNVLIEFVNSERNNLGIPLPAGNVRVYKRDAADDAMEFIGEERIDHTPKDEELSLMIGNAFDLVGERRQTDFKVESRRNWMSETIEIKLRNRKDDQAVTIDVREPMYRWRNWRITESSHEWEKRDAFNVEWSVPVEAGEEAVVTYTVEYTW
ncbi:MAG: DUF4139 domain-containing protein [Phycisphaerae bacterium]